MFQLLTIELSIH